MMLDMRIHQNMPKKFFSVLFVAVFFMKLQLYSCMACTHRVPVSQMSTKISVTLVDVVDENFKCNLLSM